MMARPTAHDDDEEEDPIGIPLEPVEGVAVEWAPPRGGDGGPESAAVAGGPHSAPLEGHRGYPPTPSHPLSRPSMAVLEGDFLRVDSCQARLGRAGPESGGMSRGGRVYSLGASSLAFRNSSRMVTNSE